MFKQLLVVVFLLLQSGIALPQGGNQNEFGMGLIEAPVHVYKSFSKVPRFRAFLPAEVDLSSRFPTPGYQGQQGSCTAWAVGYALRSYIEGRRQQWDNIRSPAQTFSPSYIYNRLHADGNCGGTAIHDALNLLKTDGVAPLSEFPYFADNCTRQPDERVNNIAGKFRIKSWRALDVSRLDDAKGRLAAGEPVVISMRTTQSFVNHRGNSIFDDIDSPLIGYHAMVLVGYSDDRQAFKLINSWGTRWGDKGFAWVSYRAMQARSRNQYVVEAFPEPTPAPVVVVAATPTPVPVPVVVVEPPKPPIPEMAQTRAAVTSLVKAVPCSRIDATVTDQRSVRLAGFIGGRDELNTLKASLSALPGVTGVDNNLKMRPWPQCEVLLNFAETMSAPQGLSISLAGGGGPEFRDGDSLVVEVTTPSYPSYVYISYLQASGEVVHLSWPQGRFPKPMPANTKLTFGGGEKGQPVYRVGPPFGDEIVVVTTSASPLFQGPLPQSADDRDYLSSFRRAFALRPKGGGGERVVSTVAATLHTQPK